MKEPTTTIRIRKVARQRIKIKASTIKSDKYPNGMSIIDYMDELSEKEIK